MFRLLILHRKKGRDSKRKADIRSVQNSLEQYYSVCGNVYPTINGVFYDPIACDSVSVNIMPTVPTDPRGTTPYFCPTPEATNCSATQYTVCTGLEAETPDTFCVSNQQWTKSSWRLSCLEIGKSAKRCEQTKLPGKESNCLVPDRSYLLAIAWIGTKH